MKTLAQAFLLLLPLAAYAERPEWLRPVQQSGQEIMDAMSKAREEVDGVISGFGEENLAPAPGRPDDELPAAREGYAVAVADGGVLFDADNLRLTYIGNVRVNDARLQMRCRNRLYIQLPHASDEKKGDEEAAGKEAGTAGAAPPAPAADGQAVDTPEAVEATGAGAETAEERQPEQPPLQARAYDVMVNCVTNNILLRSKGAEGMPHLQRAEHELALEPGGQDSLILADTNGNVHVRSGKATLHWSDKQGRKGTLVALRGGMVFHSADHSIFIDGPAQFISPDGATVDCEESLCVSLHPADKKTAASGDALFAQFTSLSYAGVESAVATGNVRACRPAAKGKPAALVTGDVCTYNGQTGESEISGKQCTLAYGAQVLHTDGSIFLASNGDITIKGSHAQGNYEWPAEEGAEPLRGTFETAGQVHFCAETGIVTLPQGLLARDAVNHFRCTGPLELQLQRKGDATAPDRKKNGMLNLAAAAYGDIAVLDATGDVDLHYVDPRRKTAMDVRGEHAVFNLEKGTANVMSAAGKECVVNYGGHHIAARSAEAVSSMAVDDKGDIDVRGERIDAILPHDGKPSKLDTSSYLTLTRSERKLELGPGSHMVSDSGILSANDALFITLAPDPQAEAKAQEVPPRYPHLSYNFSGIESAHTEKGGTVRTTKASMQCTGPINVTIPPGAQGDDMLKDLHATALGNVAVLGKDGTGRLVRATGDKLTVDGETKVLTGSRVTLADGHNTHIASGKGARITVDKNNNARISGEKHTTVATNIHKQMDDKDNKPKKD